MTVYARDAIIVPTQPRDVIESILASDLDMAARMILMLLERAMRLEGKQAVQLSAPDIAELAGCSVNTIRRRLKELEGEWLHVQTAVGHAPIYSFNPTHGGHTPAHREQTSLPRESKPPTQGGQGKGAGTTPATCGHDPYSESSSKEEDDVYKPIDTSRDEEKSSPVQAASSSDEKIRRRCEKASTRVLSHSLEGIEDTATLADIEGEVLTLLGLCYSHVSLEHASAYTSRLAGKNITGAEAMRYLQERLAEMMTRKDIDSIPKSPASAIRLMTKAEDIARFKSTLVRTGEIQVREAQGESEGWGAEGLAALEDFKRSFLEDGEVS